jgi:hypothetical protein
MSNSIPNDFLEFMIAIGETGHFDSCSEIPLRFPHLASGGVMRLAPQPWYDVAATLDTGRLTALVMALSIAENAVLNFRSGSVSPVIWLFRNLAERKFDGLDQLTDWILQHSSNPYLPFGSHNHGGKTLAEENLLALEAAKRKRERRIAEEARNSDARTYKQAKATKNLFGALRRGDVKALGSLILQGADIEAKDGESRTAREIAEAMGLGNALVVIAVNHES